MGTMLFQLPPNMPEDVLADARRLVGQDGLRDHAVPRCLEQGADARAAGVRLRRPRVAHGDDGAADCSAARRPVLVVGAHASRVLRAERLVEAVIGWLSNLHEH